MRKCLRWVQPSSGLSSPLTATSENSCFDAGCPRRPESFFSESTPSRRSTSTTISRGYLPQARRWLAVSLSQPKHVFGRSRFRRLPLRDDALKSRYAGEKRRRGTVTYYGAMSRRNAASPRGIRCERPIRLTSFAQGDAASVVRFQLPVGKQGQLPELMTAARRES